MILLKFCIQYTWFEVVMEITTNSNEVVSDSMGNVYYFSYILYRADDIIKVLYSIYVVRPQVKSSWK